MNWGDEIDPIVKNHVEARIKQSAENREAFKPLSLPEIEYNRKILIAEISSDKVVSRLQNGVNEYLHS